MKNENIPSSYKLASGEWVPKLVVRTDVGNETKEENSTWDKKFATEEEANNFVLGQVKAGQDS